MRTREVIAAALLVLGSVAAPAFAQLGLRTANPVAKNDQTGRVGFRVLGATTDTCTIKPGWTPTDGDPALALCFWNQSDQEYLKYARFVGTAKTMSASTEIVADAVGGIRIALSTAVAANTTNDQTTTRKDEPTPEQDRALNLLAANGGNLAFTASYPVYYKPIAKNSGTFLWNSYARFATNVAALGGKTESTTAFHDVNANAELAFAELSAHVLGHESKINLLGYFKGSVITGTGKFAQSLATNAKKTFLSGQLGGGLRVGQVLLIYAGYNWYSDGAIPGRGGTLSLVFGK